MTYKPGSGDAGPGEMMLLGKGTLFPRLRGVEKVLGGKKVNSFF
jgi:hypothetical protein